jgi:2-oxoglutarate dehydrogenase E2 component (dihydrolipoamide succinyltransferase)
MPKMGESIQEGKVLRWVKKVGDAVERDEVLLEISTDKVDTEVPSPSSGTLTEILAQEGDVVEVGKVIARLSGGAAAPAPAPAAAVSAPAPAPVAAPVAAAPASVAAVAVGSAATSSIPRQSGTRFYSPLVRSIAAAEGISVQELDNIQGSGVEGRVTKNDIMAHVANRGTGAVRAAAAPAPAPAAAAPAAVNAFPSSGVAVTGDIEVVPMDRVRLLIAEHMVRSKHTSPHVTSVAEADVTGIVKLRDKQKDAFLKREGFKLTFNPFFGFAVCEGVKAYPRINVSVDGKNILQHRRTNLGMATALPDGNLIVPVIKGAESLNITGVARSMNDLANKARSKKLSPDDIAGGTITVTNVGSFGSLFGTPVINQPQTAIVGIGAIQKRPVVRELEGEDVVVVRSMVYLSITYDHRVIDGALATQALAAMVKALESINENTVSL